MVWVPLTSDKPKKGCPKILSMSPFRHYITEGLTLDFFSPIGVEALLITLIPH